MKDPVTRRSFLGSTVAVGLVGRLFEDDKILAQDSKPATASHKRIDVHHHILPPDYVSKVGEAAIGAPAPNREAPKWTVGRLLTAMDGNGITAAIVSVSHPGLWFNDVQLAKYLARSSNSFAAQMVADCPARFGSFASLPLPDVSAALEELRHAFDVLKCDVVVLMTNYANRYLGDREFAPIFNELNARGAIVFVHPTSCSCSLGGMEEIPVSLIEFPHDTTRSILSLVYSGTLSRCQNIQFIFCHAGGTLPLMANRMALFAQLDRDFAARAPEGVMPFLQRLNFDTALSANHIAIPSLLKVVPVTNVMLGTDFPFAPETAMKGQLEGLSSLGLSERDLLAIEGENALRLFSRLRANVQTAETTSTGRDVESLSDNLSRNQQPTRMQSSIRPQL